MFILIRSKILGNRKAENGVLNNALSKLTILHMVKSTFSRKDHPRCNPMYRRSFILRNKLSIGSACLHFNRY